MSEAVDARLQAAREIALEAGALAIEMRNNQDGAFSSEKGHQDFLTIADLAVEELIRDRVSREFPRDSILGEEEGTTGNGNSLWVIDPIDGTTNFMRGLSDWAVSIAYCLDQKIECAAIYAPDIDTLVWARADEGAFVGNEKIRVSDRDTAETALFLLGRSARCGTDDYLPLLDQVFRKGLEYRRNGSAAFSLLSVALGRADAFYEAHLNPWDAMAGILIVKEAGGTVEHPAYAEFIERGGAVLASNTKIHDMARSVIDG